MPTTSQPRRFLVIIFQFVRPYRNMVAAAILALLFTAVINLSLGQGLRLVIDQGFIGQSSEALTDALKLLLLLVSLLALGTYFRFYLMSWLGERISADMRNAVFKRLMSLHPSYFEENRSGEIMSRLTTDTTLLQSIIGSAFSMALRSSLMLIGGLLMLMITNFKLTLVVLVAVPVVLIPMAVFGRRVRRLSRKSQDRVADIGSYAGEIIRNIKVVQSFNREPEEIQAFNNEVSQAFETARLRIQQRAILIALVIFLTFAAIGLMLWVGGMDVLAGRITPGELAAFIFYAMMVAMSVATISEVYGELQRATGAAERLLELLAVESSIRSPEKPQQPSSEAELLLEMRNVHFSYPSRPDRPALSDINLDIRRGETIALVGHSGAGKSTLFELLQRFYDPDQGSIRFHGTRLEQLDLRWLRQQMALVPQQPVLFSQDVAHNIRYGSLNATDEAMMDAARKAHAHPFIEQLPDQYKSDLGESGVRLSGGQKQRIALARAILKDPELLLLDEATSALDAESEAHVQSALEELMRSRTTLIIAHRLATVRHADRIILLDQGRIMDQGDHDQLISSSELYRRLCQLQFQDTSSDSLQQEHQATD